MGWWVSDDFSSMRLIPPAGFTGAVAQRRELRHHEQGSQGRSLCEPRCKKRQAPRTKKGDYTIMKTEKQLPERAESLTQDQERHTLADQELEVIAGGSVRKAARDGAVGGAVVGGSGGTIVGAALGAGKFKGGKLGAIGGAIGGGVGGAGVGAAAGAISGSVGRAISKARGK